MPGILEHGANAVAERICDRIRQLALPHAHSDVAAHVTVSIGIATLTPTADADFPALVSAADAALYESKHAGRNRVTAAPQAPAGETLATT